MDGPTETLDSKAELDQEEIERLLRENRALKGRLDELERENRLLKQRNFDLSMRYGRSVENRRQPFELVFSDSENEGEQDQNSDEAEGDNRVGEEDVAENSSNVSDNNNNEAGSDAGGYTVEESDISRKGGSGTEGSGAREQRLNILTGTNFSSISAPAEAAEGANPAKRRNSSSTHKSSSNLGTDRATRDASAGKFDTAASEADGSSRYADSESPALTKEKKSLRENADERQGVAGGSSRRKEAKQLKCYAELEGHEGAIYSTQYSPTGDRVASASFDKTVRIWDVGEQKPLAVLNGHHQSVFDVVWRDDSMAVASAGFDRSCIEWDIETQEATTRLQCDGLVQCLRYSTHNPRIIYAGDSSGFITIHDTREASGGTKLSNDGAMVNTIYCFNDETRLVSGDRNGEIKMWDVRIGRFMRLVSSDTQRHAISHISVVKNEKSGTEYMATNSYDNVLRVYDRVDDPSVPTPRVIHELQGIRSRNWPIKNAFLDPRVAQEKLMGLYDDDYYELDTRSQSEARGLRSMLFLITGSAEPLAYLYKLNTHSKSVRIDDKGKNGMRQRLEGHSDRVYAVATHPTEIKACTAGADSTIRLWHIPSAGRLLKEGY
ncbi:hypothetical protein LPJ66_008472 [Kickxella alabastrina]|uniref:Uncharacterized protein n=1 Tax=Kickxella alabastrina TaxID=61397 RepID=A0ACC1I687_9FUNG|nr:hypothetical protein LPJ66_008472 [Kickxella alabastrina]